MKILRNIFCMLIVLLVIVVCFRYVIKEKFFFYKYKEYVDIYSKEYGLDLMFVLFVIKIESKFDDDVYLYKNVVGFM